MNSRIRELDGIRGIAILMVLVWHFFTIQTKPVESNRLLAFFDSLTSACWSGVDLFFVLSGFLIGGIILDNHLSPNFLRVFWIRRCCRILPVAFSVVLLAWLSSLFLDQQRHAWLLDDLMPWWSYATFTQNVVMGMRETFGGNFLAVSWSLAVEEQFYLLAPVTILLLRRRLWVRLLVPMIALAFVLRLIFPGFHTYVNMVFRMDSLLAGALVAVAFRATSTWSTIERNRRWLASLGCVMAIVTIVQLFRGGFGVYGIAWFAGFYALCLLNALLFGGRKVSAPLRSKALVWLGSIAYGLYMIHQAVSGLLHGWLRGGKSPSLEGIDGIIVNALAVIAALTCAWVSFRFFEQRFLKIGKGYSFE